MISTICKVALPLTAIFALSACEMMGTSDLNATDTASDTMMTEESSVASDAVDAAN